MDFVIRANGPHALGYTALTELNGKHAWTGMDFGILRLRSGERFADARALEKAYLLVHGRVRFEWEGRVHEEFRPNCFDCPPTALHVCGSAAIALTCLSEECEIAVLRTDNERAFAGKLYLPSDTQDEMRGAGLMREAATRVVRTIFDYRSAPYANLVLGEVIGFPGKWSSYPPHHHPQPEIYYYKTQPENGFAYAELGEEVVKVRGNDAVLIAPGLTHPHSTPPGYALWYLWAIRHLEGRPYDTPTFVPEHLWVQEKDAAYWGDKC